MEDKIAEINKLKNNIKQVISLHDEKKLIINDLSENAKKFTAEIEEKNRLINDLNNKIKLLKISNTISTSTEDKVDFINKINKIVREIDKSIGLLNE